MMPRWFIATVTGAALFLAPAVRAERAQAAAEAAEPRGSAGPSVEVREGNIVNFVHRYYFPVKGWKVSGEPEADFQQLQHASLPGVILRVLVSAGNPLSIEETMKALRKQAVEDRVHVLSESRMRVGLKEAGDLLALRDAKGTDPQVVVRTVCFNREENKYYLRLEAPVDSYEMATPDFEEVVSNFKFDYRFKLPWKK